jgi:hypothetical protein
VTWIVPREAWWQTEGHEEEVPLAPTPRRRTEPWEAIKDWDRLTPEDEQVLDVLSEGEDDYEPEVRWTTVPCSFAELRCDGSAMAATEHLRFRDREGLVTFLRWLALHMATIPEGTGKPPAKSEGERRWEDHLGPSSWTPPEDPGDCQWLLSTQEGYGWAQLYCGSELTLGTVALRAGQVGDFLHWLRDSIVGIDIDPGPLWAED